MMDRPQVAAKGYEKRSLKKTKMPNFLSSRTKRRVHSDGELNEPLASVVGHVEVSSFSTIQKESGGLEDENEDDDEPDFFAMLGRLQSSRLDDQRFELPPMLKKSETLPIRSTANGTYVMGDKKDDPIKRVLDSGGPYPLVVLPVEGEYWLEGGNHLLKHAYDNQPMFPQIDLSKCILEEKPDAHFYRKGFYGREHTNFTMVDQKLGPILLSVKWEQLDSQDLDNPEPQEFYNILIRTKDLTLQDMIPASSLSDNPGPRELIQCLIEDDLVVERFHPVACAKASETIIKFDEHSITTSYKVGVIYQKFGQISEEEYFGNQEHSPAMQEFLDLLASEVKLKDFKGYRGGLDVKHGQTGDLSYYTTYQNKEIMFHVSTLLPYTPGDIQQVQKKRHIGNDIVAIVFQDENTPFSPTSVRSHFLHVFIVVQVEKPNSPHTYYKVSVTSRDGVPSFGPPLSNPAVFRKGKELRRFLLTKIINAEIAACQCEKFSQLAERTRGMLLQSLVSDLITKNENMLEEESVVNGDSSAKTSGIFLSFRSALRTRSSSYNSLPAAVKSKGEDTLSVGDSYNLVDDNDRREKEKKKLFGKTPKKDKRKVENKSPSSSPVMPIRSVSSVEKRIEGRETSKVSITYNSDNEDQNQSNRIPHTFQNLTYDYYNSGRHSPGTGSSSHFSSTVEMETSLAETTISTVYRTRPDGRPFSPYDDDGHVQPLSSIPRYVSPGSCSSSYEDVSTSSVCSALDVAQREIDVLKAEISKLRTDKMELVRQNVVQQREIKRLHDKTLQQIADLYAAQHEMARSSQTTRERSQTEKAHDLLHREVSHV